MPETTDEGKPKPRAHLDQQALTEALDGLHRGLAEIVKTLNTGLKRNRERQEVAALFGVYRERRATAGQERDRELAAILQTALEGYDTAMLADLLAFAGYITDRAQPIWESRDR